jgi:glycerol-3-phosphate dehydrogenase
VIAALIADPADSPLTTAPDYSTGELRHLAATEHVVHLDDVLLRRTLIGFRWGVTAATASEAAAAVADVLGWDAATTAAEVRRVLQWAGPESQATSSTPIMPRSS